MEDEVKQHNRDINKDFFYKLNVNEWDFHSIFWIAIQSKVITLSKNKDIGKVESKSKNGFTTSPLHYYVLEHC